MKSNLNTIETENLRMPPFFNKIQVSVERGEGSRVWDEDGKMYIDFTSGWGVTCLGHSHPAVIGAITEQAGKIMQNPQSGLTYSPARARLLDLMAEILPKGLTRVFFSNSGAEANDAAIKLARKVSGRPNVISTYRSFHGRTISTASATGQMKHRERFNPLMPNYRFVGYDDIDAMRGALDDTVAAAILEPIQGEGGVVPPSDGYLDEVSALCEKNGSYLIIDEIQTGFCRTGPMFAIGNTNAKADFLTMAKGIAGGFPFGAFAITEAVSKKLEKGDHGGTYCGNPLGCAVAYSVIRHMIDNEIGQYVMKMEKWFLENLNRLAEKFPETVLGIRGTGLLLALEICDAKTAARICQDCVELGLFVNVTQDTVVRIFPALNISMEEAELGMERFAKAFEGMRNTI